MHLASDNVLTLTKDLIKQSRTNSSPKQLVSYDTTFLLGDFHVSILVARNTCLVDDPIFPVAFLIHTKKYTKYHKAFLVDIFEETGLANSKNIPVVRGVEKEPHLRLTQLAIARQCIKKSLIGFTAATASFSVVNPFTGNVQNVKYFPKPSKCSCASLDRCFHILAVNVALGEDKSNLKCKEKYLLSMLFKKNRGKGKKSRLKRPRPNDVDYDVNPAPDVPSPLDRKLLQNPKATSTPKRNNNPPLHANNACRL